MLRPSPDNMRAVCKKLPTDMQSPRITTPYQVIDACLLLKGPKCCVLEGSPRCRGGTVVQFAQVMIRLV